MRHRLHFYAESNGAKEISMNPIVPAFILSLLLAAALSAQEPTKLPGELPRLTRSGGTIFRALFDSGSDALDGDRWPDYWTRKGGSDRGIVFPAYLDISIAESRNPFGNYALRMNMEGGAAAVFSPKIRVRRGMSYTVSAYVDAEGIVFDDVFIMLAFYGKKVELPIKTVISEKVKSTGGWRRLEIGPIVADAEDVDSVAVGLLTIHGARQDYGAQVDFANIEINESPTVTLSMQDEHHLFFDHKNIDVRCRLNGIDPAQHTVDFVLEDPFGRVIGRREVDMMIGSRPAAQFVLTNEDDWNVFQGVAVWQKLPIAGPGFYRLKVATPDSFQKSLKLPEGVFFRDPLLDAEPLTLVVMESGFFVPNGEFGWNLDGWTLEDIQKMQGILRQSGVSRLKIPAWYTGQDSTGAPSEQRRLLSEICDSLALNQVRIVGLLSPIPEEVQKEIKLGPVNAASLFSLNVDAWTAPLQPTLQELSLLVKDWQWTTDEDRSIADIPGFAEHFETFRKSFDRNDFDFGTGFAWDWNNPLPEQFSHPAPPAESPVEPASPPATEPAAEGVSPAPPTTLLRSIPRPVNEFVVLSTAFPLTHDELEHYLGQTAQSKIRRFVSLMPLPQQDYPLEDRILDFVRRMVIAKSASAEAIFLARPVSDQTGVLRSNGTPSELFLPWRTTSNLISGKRFLGSVNLPQKSRNYNFALGGGSTVMVVWNDHGTRDKPVLETLYLGEEPVFVDVWGKKIEPEQEGREQTVPVTAMPLFVTGVDSNVTRFRLAFQLGSKQIDSFPNRPNNIPFTFRNDTGFPVSAQISASGPNPGHWTVSPPVQTLALEPGASGSGQFEIRLSERANTGKRPIRIDIQVQGAEPREFTVYDEINIGEAEAFMEFSSRMNRAGNIEITQAFINNGDKEYTYSCRLIVPRCPYQTATITRQSFGRVEHIYTIPRGQQLLDSGVTEVTVQAIPVEGRTQAGQPMVYTVPLVAP